jgi:hypothetical protein
MHKVSTLFLRSVIVLMGLAVLATCIFALPAGIASDKVGYYRPILIGMYLPAIPFFIGLFQGMKLLGYIDRNQAFTGSAVEALRNIKYCAAAISAMYAAGLPYIYYAAERDDAPGVIVIGMVISFTAFVIATAAALFQRLFQNAVDIKAENDLTV